MKHLFFVLLLLFFFACGEQSDLATVSGYISVPADVRSEEVYIGLYALRTSENLGDPKIFTTSTDGAFTLQTKPGKYILGIWAKGLEDVRTRILLAKKGEQAEVKITLQKQSIPAEVNTVSVIGAFCDWKPQKAVAMVKKDDQWILDDTEILVDKQEYAFLINHQRHLVYATKNTEIAVDKKRTSFHNIYSGGEVVLIRRNFLRPGKEAEFPSIAHGRILLILWLRWMSLARYIVRCDRKTAVLPSWKQGRITLP